MDTLQHRITDSGKVPLYGIRRGTESLHYSAWTPASFRTTGLSALHSTSGPPKAGRTSGGVSDAKAETPNTQRLHRLSASRQMEGLPKITQTAHRGKLPRYNLTATVANTWTTLVHRTPADTRQRTKGDPKPPPNLRRQKKERNKQKSGVTPDVRLRELSSAYYHETTCPEVLNVKTKWINKRFF